MWKPTDTHTEERHDEQNERRWTGVSAYHTCAPYDEEHKRPVGGMSLRDWFAGQALHESLGELPDRDVDPTGWSATPLAACAYEIADAMITEREKA